LTLKRAGIYLAWPAIYIAISILYFPDLLHLTVVLFAVIEGRPERKKKDLLITSNFCY